MYVTNEKQMFDMIEDEVERLGLGHVSDEFYLIACKEATIKFTEGDNHTACLWVAPDAIHYAFFSRDTRGGYAPLLIKTFTGLSMYDVLQKMTHQWLNDFADYDLSETNESQSHARTKRC